MFTSLIELNLIIALAIASVCASSSYAQERDRIPAGLRPPRHAGIYVVAHRGVHDTIPENTLAAYRRAIELECDFVEIDVRTTKDGHLVSIHDSTIDRYTIRGEKGKVSEMTLAELQAIDIGSRIDRTAAGGGPRIGDRARYTLVYPERQSRGTSKVERFGVADARSRSGEVSLGFADDASTSHRSIHSKVFFRVLRNPLSSEERDCHCGRQGPNELGAAPFKRLALSTMAPPKKPRSNSRRSPVQASRNCSKTIAITCECAI